MNKTGSPLSLSASLSLLAVVEFVGKVLSNLDQIHIALPGHAADATLAQDKAIAEIALFLTEVFEDPGVDADLKKQCILVMERLLSLCDADRITTIIFRYPQAALAFGTVAIALKAMKRENHAIYMHVRTAIDSPFYLATSRPGFRELEALWLACRIKGCTIESVFPEIPRDGILFRPTHPSFLRREDMYAKTHMAMYLTDFGRNELKSNFDKNLLRHAFDHDLAWAFGRADWDLVGELSMAASYCLDIPSAWQISCEKAMDAIFQKFNCVPMPTYDIDYAVALSQSDRKLYLLFHSYHTTIVYGLLILAQNGRASASADISTDIASCSSLFCRAVEMNSFSFPGSGLDSNWYHSDSSPTLRFRNDFIAESIILSVCEGSGIEAAYQLTYLIEDSRNCSLVQETIDVLAAHKKAFRSPLTKSTLS